MCHVGVAIGVLPFVFERAFFLGRVTFHAVHRDAISFFVIVHEYRWTCIRPIIIISGICEDLLNLIHIEMLIQ